MEDTQLTQNYSPVAGPLVAKTSDGLNLSVQTYGGVGNDEILFIHGFGQSRLSWSKQTSSSLTEHYRVVTFDLRGHGNSDKPDHAIMRLPMRAVNNGRMIYTR
jgi:non-heme chloroperoxidase